MRTSSSFDAMQGVLFFSNDAKAFVARFLCLALFVFVNSG